MEKAINILRTAARKLKLERKVWLRQGDIDIVKKVEEEIKSVDKAILELMRKSIEESLDKESARLMRQNNDIKWDYFKSEPAKKKTRPFKIIMKIPFCKKVITSTNEMWEYDFDDNGIFWVKIGSKMGELTL